MGEISRGYISVLENDSLSWSKEVTFVAPHLKEAPCAELYSDVVMGITTPSIRLIDPICTEPLDLTPTSSAYTPLSFACIS